MILLVEDNPEDQALTLRALKKTNITEAIVTASDGVDALDFLFGTGRHTGRDLNLMPRLILLDLKLPKVDGLEVIQRVRSQDGTRYIPIVVLTSSNERSDRCRAYTLGANSYVLKPVDFLEFVDIVHRLAIYWLNVNQPAPVMKAGR